MTASAPPISAHPTPTSRLAFPALLLGAAAIAFAPIFVRLADVGPSAVGFWRVALALPLLWLMTARSEARGSAKPQNLSDYGLLLLTGLFFAADLAMWHWSIQFTTVANSTLLVNFAPIFVAAGGWLFFGERFTRTFLAGLMAALVGAFILMGDSFSLSAERLFGDSLAIGTAFFYGSYILLVGRARRRFSTGTVMLWSGVVSALVLLPVALLTEAVVLPASLYGWAVVAGLALFSHAGGQSLIAYALATLPAAFGAVSLLLQPALAAVLAWILFNEAMGVMQALGAVIILAGIVLARLGSRA